jgi:hypothetical protein
MKERKRILGDLATLNPSTKLLYITPEQAATQGFKVSTSCTSVPIALL